MPLSSIAEETIEMDKLSTKEPEDQVDGVKREVDDTDASTPAQEVMTHINRVQNMLAQLFIWGRIFIPCVIAVAVVVIIVFNFFVPDDRDIPDDVLQNLYKFMQVQAQAQFGPLTIDGKSTQWPHLPKANETNN